MKHIFLTYLFLAPILLNAGSLSVRVKSHAAILYNPDNGAILFEKNGRKSFYPASITKIATAALLLSEKESHLDDEITAEQESLASITLAAKKKAQYTLPGFWLETDGSHIGIKVGEKLKLRDILAGMMICSGNDAANVAAQALENDLPKFSEKVNAYLKKIGCLQTHFVNPHGLHHPDHMTTAYDMAILSGEAMKYPFFRETVAKLRFVRPKTNKQQEAVYLQTNRLLRKGKTYYANAIGVKTGYTSIAQSTLVAAARDGDRTLIAVLLKCKEREDIFNDAIDLFKAAFSEKPVNKVYLDAGRLSYVQAVDGGASPLEVYTVSPLQLMAYPSEEPELKAVITWESLALPIKSAQKVGSLSLVDGLGKTHAQVDLLAQSDIAYTWSGWLKSWF